MKNRHFRLLQMYQYEEWRNKKEKASFFNKKDAFSLYKMSGQTNAALSFTGMLPHRWPG